MQLAHTNLDDRETAEVAEYFGKNQVVRLAPGWSSVPRSHPPTVVEARIGY